MAATLHIYFPVHCYCNLQIYATLLQIALKIQQAAKPTSHCIAMYVPVTNIPLKCYKYGTNKKLVHVQI